MRENKESNPLFLVLIVPLILLVSCIKVVDTENAKKLSAFKIDSDGKKPALWSKVNEKPNNECLRKLELNGITLIRDSTYGYCGIQVIRENKSKYVDSINVIHSPHCRDKSIIYALEIFIGSKIQIIEPIFSIARQNQQKNVGYLNFKHCNSDGYLDMVIESGRSGNGHFVKEIFLYNSDSMRLEYNEFLSNQGSLSFDKSQNIYQSYNKGGPTSYSYRQFRIGKEDDFSLLEKIDISGLNINKIGIYVKVEQNKGARIISDSLSFATESEWENWFKGNDQLKRYREFQENYKL